ncbi:MULTISPECIES: hypothetical protein [Aphanothece]|uniref:hypothetical protein n=1 Tax=Aphanothece TaxID=1121 RepID=UPI0039856B69
MPLIRYHQYLAAVGAAFWVGTGVVAIGSIALSPRNWTPNLAMGVLFICLGWLLYLRAVSFSRFFSAMPVNIQIISFGQRFLRLDLLLVSLSCLVGALLLLASVSRVFGEGYAVFG